MLNYKKVEKILLIILEALIYLSFLMPFIFLNDSIFPFIVGKILYFQAIVQIMAIVYVLLLVLNFKKFRPKKNVLFYWFIFYAVSLLISAIFGVDFRRSFWSNFERMTGVFVVWHFISYAIIVSVVFDTWPKIKRALNVLLGVSLLQVLAVAAQYTKEGVYMYPNIGGRIWGTLGNSIYIGSYFLFHIFFALLLAFKEKRQIRQIVYLLIAILEAFIILYSRSSRGADIAFLFGIFVIIFGYALLSKNKKIRNAGIIILLLVVMCFGGLYIFRTNEKIKKIPTIGNLLNSSLSEGTGRTRAIAWEIAWKTFKERPVLGIGLENFYYAFNKHYNPESLRFSYYETWFDRSHSILFDALAMGGFIGFLAYFGLYAIGGVALAVRWLKGIVDKHILIFFFIIFSTYLIQNLFVFEHPASYFLIYFSFGLLLALISGRKSDIEPKYQFTYTSFFVVFGILLALFLALFFKTSIKTYNAAVGIIDAEKHFVKNFKVGLQKYDELFKMQTPFIFDMRSAMAKRAIRVNQAILKDYPSYKEALLFARDQLLLQTKQGGQDVYDYLLLGQIDTMLGRNDEKYLDSAEEFFAKAVELSPKRQQLYYTWAKTKLIKNDDQGAVELLKTALEFYPQLGKSYWELAIAYDKIGDQENLWQAIKKAKSAKYPYSWQSDAEIKYAISLAKKNRDIETLYKLLKTLTCRNPENSDYLKELQMVGQALGKLEEVREHIKEIQS